MRSRQSPFAIPLAPGRGLPPVWLVSDARNDAALEAAVARLPRGGGFIFRHRHLPEGQRRARLRGLQKAARRRGVVVALAGDGVTARLWGTAASYGLAAPVRGAGWPRLATAHSLREIGRANRSGAAAIVLSPAYPTRTHPGRPALGAVRFRLLVQRATRPVIALGGMNARRARQLGAAAWAAIDALS